MVFGPIEEFEMGRTKVFVGPKVSFNYQYDGKANRIVFDSPDYANWSVQVVHPDGTTKARATMEYSFPAGEANYGMWTFNGDRTEGVNDAAGNTLQVTVYPRTQEDPGRQPRGRPRRFGG